MSLDNDLEEVVHEFLVESYENLDQLDRDLIELERDPKSAERLGSVFRTIHTIKGTCGFLGFERLEGVAHVGESLLSRLRDGRLLLDADITSGLLAMVDAVRIMLARIESEGNDGEDHYPSLCARLEALQEEVAASARPAPHEAESMMETGSPREETPFSTEEEMSEIETTGVATPAAPLPVATERTFSEELEEGRREGADPEVRSSGGVAESTIRVDVHLLDRLMNLVGELVLSRNQVLQHTQQRSEAGLAATAQRLNLITTELQEGVMKTRMQPIGGVWGRFPRVVRDLAVTCGKQVDIELDGRDTELDRSIIEAIKDPLTHVVRNSIDHGIEGPAERLAAGKSATGRLRMRAFHEGGQVNIEISDDGRGIDPEKLRERAVARGLLTHEQASRLNDREAIQLIFLAGFSTAEKVSNVSGRGVGMDVVKTNVERIGGMVDVQSTVGAGTTLRMKIPLTLAIIPALLVTTAGDRFAIPQGSLLELVRLESDVAKRAVETIRGTRVYRLRGELLPLVDLKHMLRIPQESDTGSEAVNIVVLQADGRRFGLIVDAINDTEEIVVKPLGKSLKALSSYAGATIMGDGRVALILDVLGLGQEVGLVGRSHDQGVGAQARTPGEAGEAGSGDEAKATDAILVVGVGETGRLGLSLSAVDRLEEFPAERIEISGGQEVVQYRNDLLPLKRLADLLGNSLRASSDGEGAGVLQVVVCSRDGESVGLVVDRILDIVEENIELRRRLSQPGLLGSVVLQGKVTDLVDVGTLMDDLASDTPTRVAA